MRARPEDFVVEELPVTTASGAGEHLLVRLRKSGWTTPAAGDALAKAFGVGKGRIGYAGLKDRHAVTEQDFSVHVAGRALPTTPVLPEGFTLLAMDRHHRKLRRGALRGNRFRLRLRDVTATRRAIDRRLTAISHRGVPNYFGAQRFGRDGDNTDAALAWFRGERRVRDRRERGILLSAARSAVFNAVLAARVSDGTWDRPVAGDRVMLDARRSIFAAADEDPDVLRQRMMAGGVHPTGPLAGKATKLPGGDPLPAIERRVVESHDELVEGVAAAGGVADRRALRVRAYEMAWRHDAGNELSVTFSLPPGAYATTVLAAALNCYEGEVR